MTRGVLWENGQLVPKGENLCLKSATSPETGSDKSEKSNENRTHHGSDHNPTNDRNLCIFTSDGVFGKHNTSVLVRLSRVTPNVLRDLLGMAHRFATAHAARRSPSRNRHKRV